MVTDAIIASSATLLLANLCLIQLTKELFTLDNTLADGLVDATTDLNLIAVIASTIDQSVESKCTRSIGRNKD